MVLPPRTQISLTEIICHEATQNNPIILKFEEKLFTSKKKRNETTTTKTKYLRNMVTVSNLLLDKEAHVVS